MSRIKGNLITTLLVIALSFQSILCLGPRIDQHGNSGLAKNIHFGNLYEVGPGKQYANISDVPLESLIAGDIVRIYWRATPYHEKFVIGGSGTAQSPITFQGVPGPGGALPVISGESATTRLALDYWNENRGVVKVGGCSIPPDAADHIIIENLNITSGRPPYTFTDDSGNSATYVDNCAAVYMEEGSNITVRNCTLSDCGNGIFGSYSVKDVLIERCHICDNGIVGSIYEHNTYTEVERITYQFNHFGPLRANCGGNNLKDRSTGTVIRYNWIEYGNRQLDLVDSSYFFNHPAYGRTFVYGNILVEHEDSGNSQIIHFGGDSGTTSEYRGAMYFYHNTVVSTRAGHTTLFRLSTNSQVCDCRNNILYVTANGVSLGLLNGDSGGQLNLGANYLKTGWVNSHDPLIPGASITLISPNIEDISPGFVDESAQDFRLNATSVCVNASMALNPDCLPDNDVAFQYSRHQNCTPRPSAEDLGAFESGAGQITSWSRAFSGTGWFLVSIPLILANQDIVAVLSTIANDFDSVMYYDASDPNDSWKSLEVGKNSSADYMTDLLGINSSMGFWLHITNPCTLTVTGYNASSTGIALGSGWNLVGYPSNNATRTVADVMSSVPQIDRVQCSDVSSQYRIRAMQSSEVLLKGNGYWLHCTASCTWTVTW